MLFYHYPGATYVRSMNAILLLIKRMLTSFFVKEMKKQLFCTPVSKRY